jgi:hypothetical protein
MRTDLLFLGAAGIALAACGGNVVVDGGASGGLGFSGSGAGASGGGGGASGAGASGTAGAGGATLTSTGVAGGSGVASSSTGTGTGTSTGTPPTGCNSQGCAASDQGCQCTTQCTEGSFEVQCTFTTTPSACTCIVNGQAVGTCTTSSTDFTTACQINFGCCASLF